MVLKFLLTSRVAVPLVSLVFDGYSIYQSMTSQDQTPQIIEVLTSISDKIDRLSDVIEVEVKEELQLHDLHVIIDHVKVVSRVHGFFLKSPSNESRLELIKRCDKHPTDELFTKIKSYVL